MFLISFGPMITYNPKDWFRFIFRLHKADTIRKLLPMLVCISLYAGVVAYLEMDYLQLSNESVVRNIPILHSLLGFAISMLLVFRTNTAYDRWWEGRKHWGALVNNSRNLAIKLNAFLSHHDPNRSFFKKLIPRFASELRLHLQAEATRVALDDQPHPEIPHFDHTKHVPNQVADLLVSRVNLLYREQKLSGDQLILLNNELQSFLDICGACERIKNTPIPYSYNVFIKKFIFVYVMTLPFGYVFSLGYLVIPVVAIIFYVLASLELIAEEIEDPFGKDANDLPMQRIADNIKRNIEDIL